MNDLLHVAVSIACQAHAGQSDGVPRAGQEWSRNVPAKHFREVRIVGVEAGIVEFAPLSCWFDPNTTYVSKVEKFTRKYSLLSNGDGQ
jgi:hypothetical protein